MPSSNPQSIQCLGNPPFSGLWCLGAFNVQCNSAFIAIAQFIKSLLRRRLGSESGSKLSGSMNFLP